MARTPSQCSRHGVEDTDEGSRASIGTQRVTVRGEARGKGCKDKPTLDQREEGMRAPYTGQTLQSRREPSDSGQQLITWVQKQAQPIPSVESCRPAQLLWGLGNPTGSPPPHAHPSKTEKVRSPNWTWWCTSAHLQQESCELQASLSYRARPCLESKTRQTSLKASGGGGLQAQGP